MTLPSPCTHALAGGACIAALLLTACASTAATVTPSAGASPASSPTAAPEPFAGNGFRTNIPAGWQDETTNQSDIAVLRGSGTILMLLASPDLGLVVARTTPQPIPDDQLGQYLTSVSFAGTTHVSQAEPVDIDGVSGVVVTFEVIPATGSAQENEDMVVNQAGNTYEIALSTAVAHFAGDTSGLQEILNSWTWA